MGWLIPMIECGRNEDRKHIINRRTDDSLVLVRSGADDVVHSHLPLIVEMPAISHQNISPLLPGSQQGKRSQSRNPIVKVGSGW